MITLDAIDLFFILLFTGWLFYLLYKGWRKPW
jgi:hypothetical protein